MKFPAAALFLLAGLALARADVDGVKSEPDLDKRAELAADEADRDLDAARQAWQNGDWNKAMAALNELEQLAELAQTSLEETKKPPRNNRHYKDVEMKLRVLLRRLDGFRLAVDYDVREDVNRIETRVQEVHDQILDAVMTKRKGK
jgi:hypothetical protein